MAPKIDQKLKAKMNFLLTSFFGGCWWVLGGKLGWKIEPRARKKSIEKRIGKMMKKRCVLEASRGGEAMDGRGGRRVSGTP